jgi:pimeloyl-ACP methyl ester carboxylesterase
LYAAPTRVLDWSACSTAVHRDATDDHIAPLSHLQAAVEARGITAPIVLVGHSMGGRVAMRVAAMDAARTAANPRARPLLAACVIEDMDCVLRISSAPSPPGARYTLRVRVDILGR